MVYIFVKLSVIYCGFSSPWHFSSKNFARWSGNSYSGSL